MISFHLNWPIQMTERVHSEKEIDDGKYIRDRISWMLFFFVVSLPLTLFFFLKIARLSIDGETMGTNIHYPRISGLSTDCFDATFHFESEQRIRYETRCDAMWCTYKIRLTNVSSNPASVQTLAHFKLIISHFISSKHIIEISLLVRESVCGFYIFAHHLKNNCLECAMPLMSWNHCPS